MKTLLTFIAAFVLGTAAAFEKDIKTLVVTPTPQMHCASCEKKIKDGLRFERGVKDIVTSLDNQTVTVKYDADKTTEEKLLKCFVKIGYSVEVVKSGGTEGKPCCAAKDKREASCAKGGDRACCGK